LREGTEGKKTEAKMMEEKARYFVEVTLDFLDSYPDDLTLIRQDVQNRYKTKAMPAIKNLLGGNKVILMGEIDFPENLIKQMRVI